MKATDVTCVLTVTTSLAASFCRKSFHFNAFVCHVWRSRHKQAIEEEGGNPDEIIVAPDATPKKVNVTPKRAAKGEFGTRCTRSSTVQRGLVPCHCTFTWTRVFLLRCLMGYVLYHVTLASYCHKWIFGRVVGGGRSVLEENTSRKLLVEIWEKWRMVTTSTI